MGPKINGCSIADLVSAEVDRQLEKKCGDYKDLLSGALSRIASLEEELALSRRNSNNPLLFPNSFSKTNICRHWLKNQCTWKQKCRFSHGSATSTSLSDVSLDLEEVATYTKEKVDKSIQVGFSSGLSSSSGSTCAVPLPSSDPTSGPSYIAGVLQPELIDAAPSYDIVDEVVTYMLDFVVENAKQPAPVVDVTKLSSPVTGPCMPVSKDEEWVENMVKEIERLEAKYRAKYKSVEEGGVLHSSPVAIPRVDFSKVKPHLHRNLPKPDILPIQACSLDPAIYNKCTGSTNCGKDHDGSKHYVKKDTLYVEHDSSSRFTESSCPFGELPGFVTSLGVVAVPDEPIGGYVYDGGFGATTKWQLHAEAVFV